MTYLVLALAPAFAGPPDYATEIKPLLAARCGSCHGALAQKAKLRLDTAAALRKGGRSGPAVVPGKSGESLLIRAVLGDGRERMPPDGEGEPLTAAEVARLRAWIDAGAPSPQDEIAPDDPRQHWAFRRPQRSVATHPSDRERGPSSIPDKATLLRRVTLDLTGLPPTRPELHDFLSDNAPDAYERVVDRLLASPRYGERWARHWMDVWRYSDWFGRRQEKDWRNSSTTMWRWRDWIVRALNADIGYDRMVVSMLAADEAYPLDDDAQAATGFLARNYFSYNHDTWMKDQVEHTAKAFLGLTLNCCHCHDHKYDPISQEEYFRFRAFFEPVGLRHDRVAGEPDPGPFQPQDYAISRKVIATGLVRAFDERLDAPTRMYRLGNERDTFADRPPVKAAVPAVVGGAAVSIAPVTLPAEAFYPGLKSFVREEELSAAAQALATARAEKPGDALKIEAAAARLTAVEAVIAADRVKYQGAPGDAAALGKAAARAQAFARLCQARHAATRADAKTAAAAKDALAAAQKNYDQPPETYTPLTPVYPATSSGRRLALARWIASRDNPLTARVAVNHVWLRHLGGPLVETVFDFGRNGKKPSDPARLDGLAVAFMESNWSLKSLSRLIVTSRAYREQFAPRRLEAEAVRDAMLFVAGDLDARLGGREIETDQEPTTPRRSLYFSCHPEGGGRLKVLEFFDAPDPCDCYRRGESLVPQQALALTNSAFAVERSRSLARRLTAEEPTADDDALLTAAFERVLSRPPRAEERTACREFLSRQRELVGKTASADEARRRAWESLVRVLFNHHEFVTLR